MTKRRDERRFGPGPYVRGLTRGPGAWRGAFPFDLPALQDLDQLNLDHPVTLLAGDNGTGKSTILELIAAAVGFADEGGELERSGELPAVPRGLLDDAVLPALTTTKPRNGYYLRAESFFNVARF